LKNRKKLLLQAWELIQKKKSKELVFEDTSYFYKSICMSKLDNRMEIFDIATDIYRPLSDKELETLIKIGFDKFATQLQIKNTLDAIALNRNMFHIAIAKGSQKEKEFFFRKTMRRIKKLRKLLGYKQIFA
jgi:hypothetical protein|tara:strand:- start:2064 stop:2456 length:393 start_codon:yes stop_codon:yes gene_type:complete